MDRKQKRTNELQPQIWRREQVFRQKFIEFRGKRRIPEEN